MVPCHSVPSTPRTPIRRVLNSDQDEQLQPVLFPPGATRWSGPNHKPPVQFHDVPKFISARTELAHLLNSIRVVPTRGQ